MKCFEATIPLKNKPQEFEHRWEKGECQADVFLKLANQHNAQWDLKNVEIKQSEVFPTWEDFVRHNDHYGWD